jgi:small subunit ribosomal protein S3
MGHKISPISLRLSITEGWRSRWLQRGKARFLLQQDHEIRQYISKKYSKAGILRIDIERFADQLHVIIRTSRPGVLIGRGGTGIEEARKGIQKIAKLPAPPRITIPTEDIRSIAVSAQAIATNIAEQMERRMPYRRLVKQVLEQVMESGVRGVKVYVGGRLDGAEIARSEKFQKGKLPLHTLRADIDFALATAMTTFGTVGVKVWIYKGDILEKGQEQEQPREASEPQQRARRPYTPRQQNDSKKI